MGNPDTFSSVTRRFFCWYGAMGGLLIAAGCGEPGVQQVTTPPAEKGNRSRLNIMKEAGEQAALKKKAQTK